MMEVIESLFFFLVSLYSTILHCFATYEIVVSPHCQFIPNSFLLGSVWNPDCVRERKKNIKENYFHMFGFAKKYKRKKIYNLNFLKFYIWFLENDRERKL